MRSCYVSLALAFAAACGGNSSADGTKDPQGTGAPAPQKFTLTVAFANERAGRVVSNPAGIDCRGPSSCSSQFLAGTTVTLTATPERPWKRAIWSGACSGGSCLTTLTGDATATVAFEPQAYRVVDLGIPDESPWAAATSISADGRSVLVDTSSGSYLWDGTWRRIITTQYGRAFSVNDSGVVAGELEVTPKGGTHAFRWKDGQTTDLGTLGDPAKTMSRAAAVNRDGIVVGAAEGPNGIHAVSWSASGQIRDLGAGTRYSEAFGINADGVAVGSNYVDDPSYQHAVRFMPDGTRDDLGGQDAAAAAINGAGVIVGQAWFGNAPGPLLGSHGFVLTNGVMTDVGTVPGETASKLVAVNASGVAVGAASGTGASSRGIVYADGQLTDLNALIDSPEWTIEWASGIADTGDIAARGKKGNSVRAILLRPE